MKGEKLAALYVDDRLVLDAKIKQYAAKGEEISITTWTPMELDEIRLRGVVGKDWYNRYVKRK